MSFRVEQGGVQDILRRCAGAPPSDQRFAAVVHRSTQRAAFFQALCRQATVCGRRHPDAVAQGAASAIKARSAVAAQIVLIGCAGSLLSIVASTPLSELAGRSLPEGSPSAKS